MRLIGNIDGRQYLVEVKKINENGQYVVLIDGKPYDVDAQTMQSEVVAALIGHKSYDIDIDRFDLSQDPLDGRLSARVRGRVVRLDMLDERRQKMKESQSSSFAESGATKITSPMPGKILRVLVEEGADVAAGDGLIVVEAMKMENELVAPRAGRVNALNAKAGDAVDSGALLLTLI